jgi:GT2 family glycosyltransferase
MNPLVSVIIPVYNGEKFLAQAINNVIAQNYHPLEIIVVDDGSTDETAQIAAQFKEVIQYIYQENNGPATARNRGIKLAKGEVIAFLDVDDLWSENKLKIQVNYLINHPDIALVQGLIQQRKITGFTEENKPIFVNVHEPYNYINIGSAIYRKSVFDHIGLFDERMKFCEDVDWFFRAWENNISKFVLKEVTLFYQKHNHNMTKDKKIVELGLLRVFKRHLDRNRQEGKIPEELALNKPTIVEYMGISPPNN